MRKTSFERARNASEKHLCATKHKDIARERNFRTSTQIEHKRSRASARHSDARDVTEREVSRERAKRAQAHSKREAKRSRENFSSERATTTATKRKGIVKKKKIESTRRASASDEPPLKGRASEIEKFRASAQSDRNRRASEMRSDRGSFE